MTACGCVRDQHVVAMCQMYFSKEGTRKIVLPKGNCTEQDHKWCDSSSDMFGPKSLLGTPDKQLTCPNGDFCLTNPTPLSIMSVFNKLPTTLACEIRIPHNLKYPYQVIDNCFSDLGFKRFIV